MKANQTEAMELIEQPYLFWDLLCKSMPESNPVDSLADLLGISRNTVARWARPLLSDEAPTATGTRSDLDRLLIVIKYVAIPRNPELVEALLRGIRQLLDQSYAERGSEFIERISDDSLRASVMRNMKKKVRSIELAGNGVRDSRPR